MKSISFSWKRVIYFALFAMLLITPLDLLQVISGVRTLGTDPWLTPVKFALVGAILGGLASYLDPKPRPDGWQAVQYYGFIFSVTYIVTNIPINQITIFSLMVLFLLNTVLCDRWQVIKESFPFCLLLGIMGPLLEYIDVRMGGFSYTSSPGTIPLWLPVLWFSGGFLVRALVGQRLRKI